MNLRHLVTLALGWLVAGPTLAETPPNDADRVVVVRNENSPISRAVAEDYVRRRGIRYCWTRARLSAMPTARSSPAPSSSPGPRLASDRRSLN